MDWIDMREDGPYSEEDIDLSQGPFHALMGIIFRSPQPSDSSGDDISCSKFLDPTKDHYKLRLYVSARAQ